MRLLLILLSLPSFTSGCHVLGVEPGVVGLWFLDLFDNNVTFGDSLVYTFCAVTLFSIVVLRY